MMLMYIHTRELRICSGYTILYAHTYVRTYVPAHLYMHDVQYVPCMCAITFMYVICMYVHTFVCVCINIPHIRMYVYMRTCMVNWYYA